jgi:hypothetical protein
MWCVMLFVHYLYVMLHTECMCRSQASKNEQERLDQRRRELADAIQECDGKEVPLRQRLQEAENSLKRYYYIYTYTCIYMHTTCILHY